MMSCQYWEIGHAEVVAKNCARICVRYDGCHLFALIGNKSLHAQPPKVWYFGSGAGISFAGTEPVAINDGQLYTGEGCAVQCDAEDDLLLYSDGTTVWNSSHQVITTGLSGAATSTQIVTIIPSLRNDGLYYVLTTTSFDHPSTYGLAYTIIDADGNDGAGSVVKKNVQLAANMVEKLIVVPDPENTSYWVITHYQHGDQFATWQLTDSGFVVQPGQKVGPPLGRDAGYLKASEDGKRLAKAASVSNNITLFDFDPSTGVISRPLSIGASHPYGLEFSPNGNYLYATVSFNGRQIVQYDISLRTGADIGASMVVIDADPNNNYSAIMRGPNSRLYVASTLKKYVSEIHKPNERGSACAFTSIGVDLGNMMCSMGLPQVIYAKAREAAPYHSIVRTAMCSDDSTIFKLMPSRNVANAMWYITDVAKTFRDSISGLTPQYRFRKAGMYLVSVRYQRKSRIVELLPDTVVVQDPTKVHIGDDTSVCIGAMVTMKLVTSDTNLTLLWEPSDIFDDPTSFTPTLRADSSVRVLLSARNVVGCMSYDVMEVHVALPDIVAMPDTTICKGDTIALRAYGGVVYEWSPDPLSQDPSTQLPISRPETTTQYRVIGKNSTGCEDTSYVTVNVQEPPVLTISDDVTICPGEEVEIYIDGIDPNSSIVSWEPSLSLSSTRSMRTIASPVESTRYTCSAHVGACVVSKSMLINVRDNRPLPVDIPASITAVTGEGAEVSITYTHGVVFNPVLLKLRWYEYAMQVSAGSLAVMRQRSVDQNGFATALYEIRVAETPDILTTLSIGFFLNRKIAVPLEVTTTSLLCSSMDSSSTASTIYYNQCGGALRHVAFTSNGIHDMKLDLRLSTGNVEASYVSPFMGSHMLVLYDMQGRSVWSAAWNASNAEEGTLAPDTGTLVPGLYRAVLNAGGTTAYSGLVLP